MEACGAGQPVSLRLRDAYGQSRRYHFIASFLEEHLRHHAKALLG